MSTKAKPSRFAIAPPAPEPNAGREDETFIRPSAARLARTESSGEFPSYGERASERQTLPDLGMPEIPIIDLDNRLEERVQDTVPAPPWLGDD